MKHRRLRMHYTFRDFKEKGEKENLINRFFCFLFIKRNSFDSLERCCEYEISINATPKNLSSRIFWISNSRYLDQCAQKLSTVVSDDRCNFRPAVWSSAHVRPLRLVSLQGFSRLPSLPSLPVLSTLFFSLYSLFPSFLFFSFSFYQYPSSFDTYAIKADRLVHAWNTKAKETPWNK